MNDKDEFNTKHSRGSNSIVTLQHLRYVIAAADNGSFRRAAEVLLVRQSTLSRCIRQLEHSIGMTVFERSSGGVRATKAGRNFLRVSRSILEQVASLVEAARRAGQGNGGQLAIGFGTSLSTGPLRETLMNHFKRFRAGPGCLNRFSASISGASAGVRPPDGLAAG
jgi:DNA-binding transcriptional LysR family regulator